MEEKEVKVEEVKETKTTSKKKSKAPFFIIGGVALVLIAAAVAAVLLLTGNKKITISFDTDGAKTISSITINKGGSVKLPDIEKEGFILDGWYLNEERVTNDTKFTKDTTLKAKWISEDAKTFTVTFDSDGGSKVESIVVECGKELSLPTNPTKKGYEFVSWVDKNATPILDKALLTCEDITLKANWKKEETKKEETKPSNNTNKQKSYKCPNGYTLDGTKCISEVSATEDCPSGSSWSDKKSTCVATTNRTKTCEGYDIGTMCFGNFYGSIYTKTECDITLDGYWVDGPEICYTDPIDYTYTCPDGYTEGTAIELGSSFGAPKTPVCWKNMGAKAKTCPDGYSLNGSVCRKTINATYE